MALCTSGGTAFLFLKMSRTRKRMCNRNTGLTYLMVNVKLTKFSGLEPSTLVNVFNFSKILKFTLSSGYAIQLISIECFFSGFRTYLNFSTDTRISYFSGSSRYVVSETLNLHFISQTLISPQLPLIFFCEGLKRLV